MAARPPLTPELVVRAYCQGAFPMAQHRRGRIDWYSPDPRAILPLESFHVPHGLKRRLRAGTYRVTLDCEFERVIRGCAGRRAAQPGTWINDQIIEVYTELHRCGIAHSVEAWRADGEEDEPVGGLYGLALGGAFFGESMFSRATDASKVCLVRLVEHLRSRGYALLDTQIGNPHMEQFGVVEVPREDYLRRLHAALRMDVRWSEG